MKEAWKSLVLGMVGMLVVLLSWHAYQDHLLVHAIVNALNRPAPQGTLNETPPETP